MRIRRGYGEVSVWAGRRRGGGGKLCQSKWVDLRVAGQPRRVLRGQPVPSVSGEGRGGPGRGMGSSAAARGSRPGNNSLILGLRLQCQKDELTVATATDHQPSAIGLTCSLESRRLRPEPGDCGASAAVLALACTDARLIGFARFAGAEPQTLALLAAVPRRRLLSARELALKPLPLKAWVQGRRSRRESRGREADASNMAPDRREVAQPSRNPGA